MFPCAVMYLFECPWTVPILRDFTTKLIKSTQIILTFKALSLCVISFFQIQKRLRKALKQYTSIQTYCTCIKFSATYLNSSVSLNPRHLKEKGDLLSNFISLSKDSIKETKIPNSVLLSLYMTSNYMCNTVYALSLYSFIPSGDMVLASHFQHSLSSCDLENRAKITKIYSVLFYLQIIQMSMLGYNKSIPAGDMMQTRHFSTFLTPPPPPVTLKMRLISTNYYEFFYISQRYICASLFKINPPLQEAECRHFNFQNSLTFFILGSGSQCHPNRISTCQSSNDISMQIWLNAISHFRR